MKCRHKIQIFWLSLDFISCNFAAFQRYACALAFVLVFNDAENKYADSMVPRSISESSPRLYHLNINISIGWHWTEKKSSIYHIFAKSRNEMVGDGQVFPYRGCVRREGSKTNFVENSPFARESSSRRQLTYFQRNSGATVHSQRSN